MTRIEQDVPFLRDDHASHHLGRRITRFEKSVARRQAFLILRRIRIEASRHEVIGNRDRQQPETVGEQFGGEVQMHQDFEHRQAWAGRGVDHRPTSRIPPATPQARAFAVQRGMGGLAQSIDDHAAMPCAILPSRAWTARTP